MVEKNIKFDTLLSREYQMRYEPSANDDNPTFKVVEHKTRPLIHDVTKSYPYRRSLSALLNSKKGDPIFDKNYSELHTYEASL